MKIASIQTRLLLFLLPLFIFSFGILLGISYSLSQHSLTTSANETAMSIGADYANRVRADIDEKMAHLAELAATDRIQSGSREQIISAMADAYQRLGVFDAIIYINPSGYGVRWNQTINQYSDREYFKKVLATKKPYVSKPLISNSTGKISFMLVVPVIKDNQVKGILAATYTLDRLTELIKGLTFKETGYGSIVDNSGLLLAHPRKPELEGKLNYAEKKINSGLKLKQTEFDDREIALFNKTVESGSVTLGTYTFVDGVDQVAVYTPIKLPGEQQWVMIVAAPAAEATKETVTLAWTMFTISTIFIIIVVLCIIMISRHFARPVALIRDECLLLTQGDLREGKHSVESQDEIGQLSQGFRAMRFNLHNIIMRIRSHAEQVAASSEKLIASAKQSAQATTQVVASIAEVAEGATKQASTVASTVSVVEQMSAGIQQVAVNANAVSVMTDKTTSAADQGDKAVDAAINQMKNIEQSVSNSAQVVAKLGERSKEIGQIVDVISDIAGKTNLLALNAAIEAAQAGEHGRGFAVVADEVRKLAEQSQEAAKQIARLISEIQTETDSAVTAMKDGTREVEVGTEVVNTAGQAFKEIVSLIAEVSSQIRGIFAAIQQMASGSQQIVASVRAIGRISKEAVGQTQTVSAATEEQSASIEEIAASIQALAKMAEELQSTVRKFRV